MKSVAANPLFAEMKQRLKIAVKLMTFNLLVKQFTIGSYLLKIIPGNLAKGQLINFYSIKTKTTVPNNIR